MAINTTNEKFMHELGDIYDAEHQFLKGQQQMLENATDPMLQQMITTHIQETEQQIQNIEQVFSLLGSKSQRESCAGAKGIVTEGQMLMKETASAPALRDCAIAGGASKVEHYEISTYRGLITGAKLMGQQEIVRLLQQNLQQEEKTAQMIEQNLPTLLQTAIAEEGMIVQQGQYSGTGANL